jgi:predicted nucleic acid-binding protein
VVIRLVEGNAQARRPLEARLAGVMGLERSLVTSRISRLECRAKPVQQDDAETLALFDALFSSIELLVFELTPSIIERATDLRAKYQFKTPDAIHYATAVEAGATAFLTGDRRFIHCKEVPVEIL